MTPKEAAGAKFAQLKRMACDKRLTASSFQVGILLLDNFNAARGYAWPSQARLAEETGLNRTTVTRAWQQLQAYGYFLVQENKGRGRTNRYIPAFAWSSDIDEAVHADIGEGVHTKGCMPAQKRTNAFNKTPSMSPFKESKVSRARARSTGPKVKKSIVRADWEPSPENCTYAVRAGIAPGDLKAEVERFTDHWRMKGERKADWQAAWRIWVRIAIGMRRKVTKGTGFENIRAARAIDGGV